MAELAAALGKADDASAYASLRASLIADFNAAWLAGGVYGNANHDGLQTANSAALGIGAPSAGDAAAVAAALSSDVVSAHGGHWSVGIIGMRFLHAALTDAGAGNVALDTLLQTAYPSFGYMFGGADETPATTLWELPDAPSEGPGMNSRNHHMFASVGGWLYEDLAGIDQVRKFDSNYAPADPAQVAFRHAVLMPRVTAHPALQTASATYRSMSGPYTITWLGANASSGGGYNCVADAPENAPVALSCASGVFTKVDFASFGTPTGACGAFAKGACDAANTSAVVAAACLGKAACSIDVSTSVFGDPCFNTLKHFDAALTCSSAGAKPVVTIEAAVPANARATVRLPIPGGIPPANLTVTEGGATVFAGGAFRPGVEGVYGAAVRTSDAPTGTYTVDVEVGAGVFLLAATS